MTDRKTPSTVEHIKAGSNYLRGSIVQELSNPSDAFEGPTGQLLKHHGMYQQHDRDRRPTVGPDGQKSGRAYSLMVRLKIPGGKLTAEQLLAQLDLCDELGNATLRITNRQDIQLHGVLKRNIRAAIRRIDQVQLTTLGACGDVERNVMCCPAPFCQTPIHRAIQQTAARLSTHLLPQTTAYHEIWLSDPDTGQEHLAAGGSDGHEVEPLYGASYLPRKFKTAIALPHDNCVDVYANDLGLLAVCREDRLAGYNVLVGGGFGVTPSNKRTFPALAQRLGFVAPDEVLQVAVAVVKVHRDFGDRCDRKRARLKYLLADWGLQRFKAKVEEYLGRRLPEPDPAEVSGFDDHLGWHAQGDGRWFYGLNVENGRVLDREDFTLKSALREICRQKRPAIRLTPHQSILFGDLHPDDRPWLEDTLRSHGVKLSHEISNARRWSMACVALPTCPLAVTESERVLPGLIDQLEAELARLGLAAQRFTIRMTGCPNGCARPYNADVGLVGRTLGKYAIYLGGRLLGDRLAFVYRDLVPLAGLVPALLPVFAYFKQERREEETFGDFCHRKGAAELQERCALAGDKVTGGEGDKGRR
jgi:sulfite reductase (ferredoxin)